MNPGSHPVGIAPGPSPFTIGEVWYTDQGTTKAIGWINTLGENGAEYSAGLNPGSEPFGIAPGPDGGMWFTDRGATKAIGRITPAGQITEISAGLNPGSDPYQLALGSDGNLWFTDRGATKAIGRITPAGQITEYSAGLGAGSDPTEIAPGPDGNLWFTDAGARKAIGRVTPAGQITEYSKGLPAGSDPAGIAPGPDGNLWFTDQGATKAIGRVTPLGAVSEFSAGLNAGSVPYQLALGPDGNLWFTDDGATKAIGRITPGGAITEFPYFLSASPAEKIPAFIAPGPDGNVWFTDQDTGEVGVAWGSVSSWEFGGGEAALLGGAASDYPHVEGTGRVETPQRCTPATWRSWASQQPSASLYALDGYRWWLDSASPWGPAQLVGSAQTYTPPAASAGRELHCEETVTYPLLDLTVSAYAPGGVALWQGSPQVLVPLHPLLAAVRQTHRSWREGGRLARIARVHAPPLGTTFAFTLNERAGVIFDFREHVAGREVAGRCVAATRANARHRLCARTVGAGRLSFTAHPGINRVAFQGRLSPARRLRLGRYTLIITATSSVGARSARAFLDFTILP
jgi:streptogramin lyase